MGESRTVVSVSWMEKIGTVRSNVLPKVTQLVRIPVQEIHSPSEPLHYPPCRSSIRNHLSTNWIRQWEGPCGSDPWVREWGGPCGGQVLKGTQVLQSAHWYKLCWILEPSFPRILYYFSFILLPSPPQRVTWPGHSGTNSDQETSRWRFWSKIHRSLAARPWAGHLTSLSLWESEHESTS